MPASNTIDSEIDFGTNFALFDSNVQKTGDFVTLKYDEVVWVDQPHATTVENVNPFHVISFSDGTITLSPERDTWVRTIRNDGGNEDQALLSRISQITTQTSQADIQAIINRLRSNGNIQTGTINVNRSNTTIGSGNIVSGTDTIRDQRVSVRDGIISTGDDAFMRSRNVSFNAIGLCPFQPHYQFLDGNSGDNWRWNSRRNRRFWWSKWRNSAQCSDKYASIINKRCSVWICWILCIAMAS